MAWVLRYGFNVSWVGPDGVGMTASPTLQGATGSVNGQRLAFFNSGAPASATFTTTDITNMVNTMSADVSAQLNANIARIAGFSSGGG